MMEESTCTKIEIINQIFSLFLKNLAGQSSNFFFVTHEQTRARRSPRRAYAFDRRRRRRRRRRFGVETTPKTKGR